MREVSLTVDKFLDFVFTHSVTYDEIYRYIFRTTSFDELKLATFRSQIEGWLENRIYSECKKMERENPQIEFCELLDKEGILKKIIKENELIDIQLNKINKILDKGIDNSINYIPKKLELNDEDYHRVKSILNYTNPLLNGIPVMDGNDYVGEILNDEKILKGAKIIQNLYEQYKDFEFDVKALYQLSPSCIYTKWHVFKKLFDEYNYESRFLAELMPPDSSKTKSDIENYKKYSSHSKGEIKLTFANIFTCNNWEKYINVLTQCDPPLLKREQKKYYFIGNKKTQKGCVAQWFKYLRNKGYIDQNISRDELAQLLSNEIINFSISGSSIDNRSRTYRDFEPQLNDLLEKQLA